MRRRLRARRASVSSTSRRSASTSRTRRDEHGPARRAGEHGGQDDLVVPPSTWRLPPRSQSPARSRARSAAEDRRSPRAPARVEQLAPRGRRGRAGGSSGASAIQASTAGAGATPGRERAACSRSTNSSSRLDAAPSPPSRRPSSPCRAPARGRAARPRPPLPQRDVAEHGDDGGGRRRSRSERRAPRARTRASAPASSALGQEPPDHRLGLRVGALADVRVADDALACRRAPRSATPSCRSASRSRSRCPARPGYRTPSSSCRGHDLVVRLLPEELRGVDADDGEPRPSRTARASPATAGSRSCSCFSRTSRTPRAPRARAAPPASAARC